MLFISNISDESLIINYFPTEQKSVRQQKVNFGY